LAMLAKKNFSLYNYYMMLHVPNACSVVELTDCTRSQNDVLQPKLLTVLTPIILGLAIVYSRPADKRLSASSANTDAIVSLSGHCLYYHRRLGVSRYRNSFCHHGVFLLLSRR
jgi:hypothetical protein